MKNKVLYALFSVLIAFGLWFYVITVVSPESEQTYYNIPVVLNNESVLNDKGLMIVNDKEPTVTLRLRGNRSDLNNLKNSDITLIADLSKINEAGLQHLSYSISYPGIFADNAFEVLSHTPDKITLEVVEWDTKEVPVNVTTINKTLPDYFVDKDNTVVDHEKVTITGPKDVVDRITQAVIEVDLNHQKETISEAYRYTLCDKDGKPVDAAQVQTNVAQVHVTVRILRVKELQLKVEIDTQNSGLTQDEISVVYSQQTIKVAGSERLLENLGDTLVLGTKTITDILNNSTYVFTPELPEGIIDITNTESVAVTITFPNMESTKVSVSKITTINVPTGMTPIINTTSLKVTLLGSKDKIEQLQTEQIDIEVLVDLTGAEVGTSPFKAQIRINTPGFEGVRIVVTDNVYVELTREQPNA